MLTTTDQANFLDAIAAAGLAPHKSLAIETDGKIRRYRIANEKSGSLNGWYAVYTNMGVYAGAFGSWKTGESHAWCSKAKNEISPAEREALKLRYEQVKSERAAEQKKVWADAAKKAEYLWNKGAPAKSGDDTAHAYIKAKGIKPYGVKTLRESLIVPARNAARVITTLQFINPDGQKKFLTGGQITGSYFSIGKPDKVLLICEGFATGATLYEATGHAVAVAFNAGNLKPVAEALRARLPDLTILICGDNDAGTDGNPGLTKAREAAAAIGARFVVPNFGVAA